MCGLVAVITKSSYGFSQEQKDIFSILLYLDVIRGEDSTGVFMVDNLGNVKGAKSAAVAADFIRTPEYKELRNEAFQKGWAMVGHNRKATRGNITDRNAHPFAVDDKIVLVHNGSLNGSHKDLADTEVDSEAIAHTLAKVEDPEIALRKINGAYALMWYEVDHKRLNFIRNLQRPLFYVETKDSYIFASEQCFLDFVISKFNLKPEHGPYQLKEYNLFSLTLNKDKRTSSRNKELDCSYYKHNMQQSNNDSTPGGRGSTNHPFRQHLWPWAGHGSEVEDDGDLCSMQKYYSGFSQNDSKPTLTLAYNNKDKKVINTLDRTCIKNFLDTIKVDCRVVSWAEYNKFQATYVKGSKIRVVVENLAEADDEPKTKDFIMIGRCVGMDNVYSIFHLHESNFEYLCRLTNDSVFEMEVDRVAWNRTEPHDTKKPMDEWMGVISVHGINPTAVAVPTIKESISNATH